MKDKKKNQAWFNRFVKCDYVKGNTLLYNDDDLLLGLSL